MSDNDTPQPEGNGENTTAADRITRRAALRSGAATVGASAAGLAGVTGAVTMSVADVVRGSHCDTITVPSNTKQNIHVGSGEVWENKLIDITADGASVQIIPSGNDWVVRNVGIRGVHPGGHYVLTPEVLDHDSTGIVEHFYAGDGQVAGSCKGFCWVQYDHRGTLEFRNVNVQHFVDNGIYGTSPGYEAGTHGRTNIYDSYFYSNNITNCRTGTQEGTHGHTCIVRGNTIVVDDTVPPCDCGCSSPGAQNSRAVWAWTGGVEVSDCDIQVDTNYGGYFETANGGYYTNDPWADNRTGSAADTSVPAGVPTSAEEAACDHDDDAEQVAEDFGHNDIPGTYAHDTGAFTTTSTRSSSGSYSLRVDDDADDNKIILRDDMETSAGETYELDVYHQSDADADMGFLFGAQSGTGFDDYVGYLGFFDTNANEIRIDRWDNLSQVASAATGLDWPLDEWLTVELDYRDASDGTITMTVVDAAGNELGSVSLDDTTYDSGAIGWYNYWATADWHADSWFPEQPEAIEPTAIDDFERGSPLAEYGGATSLYGVETSTVYEGTQALVNDGGSYGSAVSTAGLDAYPDRGEEVHYHFTNATDDNFVACHFFAQTEEDAPDGYTVGISSEGAWRMWVQENGEMSQIANEELSSADQIDGWYRAEVWSDATTVYADLYDDENDVLIASIQADDTTYTAGGIGFRSAGNGEIWDYAVRGPIEDFERSTPLSEYGGATDLYSVESSVAYEGAALTNDGGSFGSAVSASGLREYPDRGDQIAYYFNNAGDDNFVAFHLFAQSESDAPDGYTVGISSEGAWRLWVQEDGSMETIADQDLPASEQIDGWYRARVWSDASTVYADLYDDANDTLLASISADDATYASGGIGFRSAGNGEIWDYVIR